MFLRYQLEILSIINFLKITFILPIMASVSYADGYSTVAVSSLPMFNMTIAANHLLHPVEVNRHPHLHSALTELSG